MLEQGLFEDALRLMESEPPSSQPDTIVSALTLIALAKIHMHELPGAEQALTEALKICDTSETPSCGDLYQAVGILASERSKSSSAEEFYERSLSFARAHGDPFLESTSLLNLGFESLAQGRLDEAIERSEASYQSAQKIGAKVIELVAEGNMGWAYYRLGDSEKALDLSLEAEKKADKVGDIFDQENELTNIGYIYMDSRDFDSAARSFQQALSLAEGIKAKGDIYNALRVLARLSLETGDLTNATRYAKQAMEIAQGGGSRVDELYPTLVRGQVAAIGGNHEEAEYKFREVELDKSTPVFLKWEAQHSLARLFEDETRADAADREYRAALSTFETARRTVRHEGYQLSFLNNATRIYDDYVHFLIAQRKTDDALRWADYSRARTLAEGLGLVAREPSTGPSPLNPQQVAQRAHGTIFFYWLGPKQSYLWAITPQRTELFTLPPASEIDAVVRRYRKALVGPQDILETASADGTVLYRMLISPAQALLTKDAQVFIIPDGSLNSLNFETLLVPEPKLHYWIEDATIADASSLRLLAASHNSLHESKTDASKLLLIGDAVAPNPDYRDLPKAGIEIENVQKHFAPAGREVFTRTEATAPAYLKSAPEQFTYIHFVAHGTASRLSPLDSAVILSKVPGEDDSFKLYARDIIRHPLRADLVTISTCYGAGARAYTGEGLVGLSWAFLRAGAHNVIGALWEVSDASTPRLMDQLYDELKKGRSPEAALRSAKLSLLHSDAFRKPFYWAPFQLYAGT